METTGLFVMKIITGLVTATLVLGKPRKIVLRS